MKKNLVMLLTAVAVSSALLFGCGTATADDANAVEDFVEVSEEASTEEVSEEVSEEASTEEVSEEASTEEVSEEASTEEVSEEVSEELIEEASEADAE